MSTDIDLSIDLPDAIHITNEPTTVHGRQIVPALAIPLPGNIPITGSSTKKCPGCAGDGTITTERERRIDELYDSQIQALFEADMFREFGDEDDRKEIRRQQNRAQHATPSGAGGHGL